MGVIHRDIKPANMLWTKGRARVKLTDFGVACFTKPLQGNYDDAPDNSPSLDKEDRLNKTEGTPAFYAPEQAYSQNGLSVPTFKPGERPPGFKGNEIYPMTKALDIWAFGVSIYCFLFGHPPFWGDNVYALCNEILQSEYEIPQNATADSLPVASDNPDLKEALRLMKGMMTKPVYARMTLSEAKVSEQPGHFLSISTLQQRSPWLTGDLEDPAAWLRETDPEAKERENDLLRVHDTEEAVAPKNHATRVSSIMRALFIRKENSRHRRDVKSKAQSQISLEPSTHRQLPQKPRSLYRPSADQPSSPIDLAGASAASSPTGSNHHGEYFGRSAGATPNGRTGGLSRMVSTLFRRSKKSTSAEAIMTAPAPITPIVPRAKAIHDLSAPSSPPNIMSLHYRQPYHLEETELDPRLITYSSEEGSEDSDLDGERDVDLVGYGGYGGFDSHPFDRSPSEGSRSLIRRFDPERSVGPMRRLSTTTSDPLNVQRVYDPLYSQHTNADEYRDDTASPPPCSPRQETIYIPSASTAPPPPQLVRSRGHREFPVDEDSDDEGTALQMGRKTRHRHHEP
jgi:serine/threonine protein kinase